MADIKELLKRAKRSTGKKKKWDKDDTDTDVKEDSGKGFWAAKSKK
jgi:hypothetical protein